MRPLTKQFFHDNLLGLSLTLIGVLCLALSVMLNVGHHDFSRLALAEGGLDGPDIDILERQNRAYERIADTVTPSIVNIRTTQVIKVQQSPFFSDPFFKQFFGDMFPQVPRRQYENALGSGVIVNPDGYIVTNNHVIQRASDIEVMLRDKRTFKGKVVGRDPQTDLAVVKIEASDLPTVPLGDSSNLRVGDTVMAFGNPFGLNFTVTRGSVSALGRSAPDLEKLENFIQTDAAINPGNSGGALVNVRGQVIGIPTWIVSGNAGPGGQGGFIGLGFAIPSDTVKHVMQDLIKTGKVSRGYLGVKIGSLDAKLARQFNVPDTSGALVEELTAGGPADKAGLKEGDVVRKLNGQTVESSDQLMAMVANSNPGTTVTLEVLREGRPMEVRVALGERPANLPVAAGLGKAPLEGTLRGLSVQNLAPAMREQLGLPSNVKGVVISEVDPSSPAAHAGLQPGDVIESINRHPVTSVADFTRLAAQAKGETLLRVNRGGESQFLVLSPGGGDNDGGDEEQ